ncbi:MAG: ATP-binding protein [Methylobacter sp.]|uniref:ATP-binding protein n=1 Tax=Methylobacter sp. TaxID=2051955 RepID=UPI00272F50EC|nr:ATP-binding protein [Methylobacter sp.]MDP1666233.1 ATP-binding protein [Methylobacter sp.]MDP1970250.1 ATP-binding protein [Methylobacter sp.]
MQVKSLSFRLLVSAGLVLAAFFALASVVLEQGFRESAEEALKEKLQVYVYSLLSAAELKNSGELSMPANLPEPQFATPGSGLYGFIHLAKKNLVWRSPSAIGLNVALPPELSAGNSAFLLSEHGRYALHYAVIWKNVVGIEREYIFTVTEDAQFVGNQVERFRETLRVWLLALGLVLIFIQLALLRWSIKPLRMIVKDLEAIEKGRKTHLDGDYATELESLAGNLNAFINSERAHLERYRNALADLAHSLKTPLSILRGCAESFSVNKETVKEQILRMDEIVEYQLQRAAAKGEHKTTGTVDLSMIINKISASLGKVYIDKNIVFDITVPEQSLIYYDEGDLYEIAGNLMDNACKWCRNTVKVNVSLNERKGRRNFSVLLEIEDDGPGIPAGKLAEILKRGVRADENIHGHGIGMAVVYELVALLGGLLEGKKSEVLGGMKWSVYLS